MIALTNTYNAVRGADSLTFTVVLTIAVVVLAGFLAWGIYKCFKD